MPTPKKAGWRSPQPADFEKYWMPASGDEGAQSKPSSAKFAAGGATSEGILPRLLRSGWPRTLSAFIVGAVLVLIVEEWRLSDYYQVTVQPQSKKVNELQTKIADVEVSLKNQVAKNATLAESLKNQETFTSRRLREEMAPSWDTLRDALARWKSQVETQDPDDKKLKTATQDLLRADDEAGRRLDAIIRKQTSAKPR